MLNSYFLFAIQLTDGAQSNRLREPQILHSHRLFACIASRPTERTVHNAIFIFFFRLTSNSKVRVARALQKSTQPHIFNQPNYNSSNRNLFIVLQVCQNKFYKMVAPKKQVIIKTISDVKRNKNQIVHHVKSKCKSEVMFPNAECTKSLFFYSFFTEKGFRVYQCPPGIGDEIRQILLGLQTNLEVPPPRQGKIGHHRQQYPTPKVR